MLSIVWQLLVEPGAHTVTLTVGILITPCRPLPTVTATVFAAFAAIGCWVGLAGKVPPFRPPCEFELEFE
jgi:hypothetical protein